MMNLLTKGETCMNSSISTNENKSEFLANLSILRQTHLFSTLTPEVVKLSAYLCTREEYKNGEHLFRTGDDDGCSYYILRGSATLILENNGNPLSVRTYPKESFLGTLSMLSPMPRLFSLRAAEDLTAIVITREKFAMVIAKFPELTMQIIRAVTRRINESERQTIDRYKKNSGNTGDIAVTSLI